MYSHSSFEVPKTLLIEPSSEHLYILSILSTPLTPITKTFPSSSILNPFSSFTTEGKS